MSRRRRPLRIGDRVAPDEAQFLESFRRLPSDLRRSVGECIRSMPPGISGDEKVRRICLTILGHPRDVVDAIIVQERRAALRVV
jgi:hypothetical protein